MPIFIIYIALIITNYYRKQKDLKEEIHPMSEKICAKYGKAANFP